MDLSQHHWKCGTCGKWHTGVPLDVGFTYPDTYLELSEREKKKAFVNADFCALERIGYYFVRGIISIPVNGHGTDFRYGPWASISQQDYRFTVDHWNDPKVESYPSIQGTLDSEITGYPNTRGLQLELRLKVETRPYFTLKPAKHPLVREQQEGITLERVQQIDGYYED